MLTAEIRRQGVVVCDVLIPQNAKDLKYSQSLEFTQLNDSIREWLTEKIKNEEQYELEYRAKVAEAVASVLNIDESILLNMKYNESDFLYKAWQDIEDIINNFVPQENAGQFEHDGRTYTIPDLTLSAITRTRYMKNANDNFTLQQVIEIGNVEKKLTEAVRGINAMQDDQEIEVYGRRISKDKAIVQKTYTSVLRKLCLCLANPLDIPNDATFDQWLEERMLEIKDISYQDAMNTIFFLTITPIAFNLLNVSNIITSQFQSEKHQRKTPETLVIE